MSTDFGKFFTNFQKNFAAVFLTFGAARARAYCTRSYAASRLFKGDKCPFTARFCRTYFNGHFTTRSFLRARSVFCRALTYK